MFFQALNTPKLVFGRGSALDTTGGAYDAPPPPTRLETHWLRVPERILFRLAVLVYRCLHGSTWHQIFSASQTSVPVGDCVRRLRQRLLLHVPCVLPSATEPSGTAAAASVWNSLPETVRSSPSLPVFCSRLKTELFARSYSCSD